MSAELSVKQHWINVRLDPHELHNIKNKFIRMLEEDLPEQAYQNYIEENTSLIPREFIQNHGIHFDMVFRKISLAKDYAPDFFYLSKSSADWNLVFVEIEKPRSRYFKDNSTDLHPEFLAGLDQIARWRAWFDNQANLIGFIDSTIASVRVPEIMRRNKCYIKYVLVHGRRSEFEGSELKRGLIRAREADDFHIMSFDSLVESLHSKGQLYLCVRKNEHVDIISKRFIDEAVFSCMEPSQLRITDELREDIINNRSNWFHRSTKGGMMFDQNLQQVGRCVV